MWMVQSYNIVCICLYFVINVNITYSCSCLFLQSCTIPLLTKLVVNVIWTTIQPNVGWFSAVYKYLYTFTHFVKWNTVHAFMHKITTLYHTTIYTHGCEQITADYNILRLLAKTVLIKLFTI